MAQIPSLAPSFQFGPQEPGRLPVVPKPPDKDPAKAYADALGDLNALSLDSLDGSSTGSGLSPGPLHSPPGQENSFADARLDAPEPPPLRSGDSSAPPDSEADGSELGLDLALVEGGAVMVSRQDLARGKREVEKAEEPVLESRGATGVAAPAFDGPAPAGHVARPQGLFFFDPVSNVLAGVAISALVAIAPAWTLATAAANGDEAEALIAELETLHQEIEVLEDPTRGESGPQTLEAVTAALSGKADEVDAKAGELESIVSSAHTRFWGTWLGLGLPLAIALSVLRRRS